MGKRGPKPKDPAQTRQYPNPGTWCECGNEKTWSAQSCLRCAAIDGTRLKGEIVSELRIEREMTIWQIANALDVSYNSTQKALLRLQKSGRVRKHDPLGPVGTQDLWKWVG